MTWVCKILDVPYHRVWQLVAEGKLSAPIKKGDPSSRCQLHFNRDEVIKLVGKVPPRHDYRPRRKNIDNYARLFELFEQGKTLVEIVKLENLKPNDVREAHRLFVLGFNPEPESIPVESKVMIEALREKTKLAEIQKEMTEIRERTKLERSRLSNATKQAIAHARAMSVASGKK